MFFGRSLLALAPLLATVAYAAECANYDGNMSPFLSGHEDLLWSLRQRMCGDGECGSQQECTLRGYSKDGGASLYRKDVQYNYPNCWVCNPELCLCWMNEPGWAVSNEWFFWNRTPLRTSSHNVIGTGGHKDGGNWMMNFIRWDLSPLYHPCHNIRRWLIELHVLAQCLSWLCIQERPRKYCRSGGGWTGDVIRDYLDDCRKRE